MDPKRLLKYPCAIRPLSEDEGGGFLATFPDLPGIMSDGETPEEALTNGRDALKCALEAMEEWGDPIPEPGQATGKMALRLPKSLHLRLVAREEADGVSINTTAVSLIAAGLGQGAIRAGGAPSKGTTRGKPGSRRARPKPARKAS